MLRVATLNIWNRSGPWERRLELIRDELHALAPDLLGLQEVLRLETPDGPLDQAQQIGEGEPWHVAYGSAKELGPGLHFGNALLSRWPIVTHENHALPQPEGHDESRAVLYALVDAPVGKVAVFVTHLNWKLHEGANRVRQVRFLADLIAEKAPVKEVEFPPILMGDLNAEPDSDEIRFLSGLATIDGRSVFFADAWHWAGDGGPGYTFDRRNAYAARDHEPPRRIDYIFVRGPDRRYRGEPLRCRLAFCEPKDDVWPSDHFGLIAELSTEEAAT
ncbi:MAG: endonuclease/exonuclease/phosphatase family protein [Myxococcota bacterium]